MALDPRTPVLVGTGQVNQRTDADTPFSEIPEPIDLMEQAARLAAGDAGAAELLGAIDTISVANIFSWRYRDPGVLLGERLGAVPKRTFTRAPAATRRSCWSTTRPPTSWPGMLTWCSSVARRCGVHATR